MKLLTLNVWGGKKPDLLKDFFKQYRQEVDIFCLQEVNNFSPDADLDDPERMPDILSHIDQTLKDYQYFFRPSIKEPYGLAAFVHKKRTVEKEGDTFVSGNREDGVNYGGRKDHTRNVQYLQLTTDEKPIFVHNFHGMWSAEGKIDTERRIQQNKNLASHLQKHDDPQIVCGDFNMRPDTKSMAIIESAGFRNLVTEFGVTDTRTSFYDKDERFADYILASSGITVNDFRVLPDEVSDHAPLLLDFSIL